MNETRFPAGGRFHFLSSSETLPRLAGNSLLVIQKAKLLNMNSELWVPPQVKGDSGKIKIMWRNLIHTKLLQMTKESTAVNTISLFMYLFIVLIEYQGWSI